MGRLPRFVLPTSDVMHCTVCGHPGEGRFCTSCGVTLEETECPSCGHECEAGSRYCTECGAALSAPSGGRGDRRSGEGATSSTELGWWMAGALLVTLLVVGGWAVLSRDGSAEAGPSSSPTGAGPEALGPAPQVDLSSMTPREAADRLFGRVMQALDRDDAQEVQSFLPMAMDAYERARPLDQDGLFHLSLLQAVAGEYETALATAHEVLDESPDHLLALAAAAEAARALDRDEEAAEYYRSFLQAWERERARDDRREYEEHRTLLPQLRADAETFLQERSR